MNGAVLPIEFRSSFTIILKKSRFGGGTRNVMFSQEPGIGDATKTTSKGKTLHVSVGPGLPNTTRKCFYYCYRCGKSVVIFVFLLNYRAPFSFILFIFVNSHFLLQD